MQELNAPCDVQGQQKAGPPGNFYPRVDEIVKITELHILHDQCHRLKRNAAETYYIWMGKPGHQPHFAAKLLEDFRARFCEERERERERE